MNNSYNLENLEELHEGIVSNQVYPKEYTVLRLLMILISVFFAMITSSLVVCMLNNECKANVPTIQSLLSSQISAPYMYLGLTAALYVFFITCLAMYIKTNNMFVVVTGLGVYVGVGVILFIFPFVGWKKNWAVVIFICMYLLWMSVVMYSCRKSYRRKLKLLGFCCILGYVGSSIGYIVFKTLQPTTAKHTEIGILVSEIIGAFAVIGFMSFAITYVKDVKITITPQ